MLNLVGTILRRAGYDVESFDDPEAALRAVQGQPSRALAMITDVEMPGMRGPELATRLAQARGDLPVLFMSGSARAPELLPNQAFVSKPFTPDELLRSLRSVLTSGS